MKGTLRLFLTLCMAVLSMTLVQAQEKSYSGVVKGSDGQPIIGASVEVVGTTSGTSTGLDGDYSIQAKQGSKLKFSFLGTKSVTVTAGASTLLNVTLEDDAQSLDQVVVVAYGTTKKKDLTGSVGTVDSKLIEQQSNSTLAKALEGAVPGIQVSSVDGQPGQDVGIRIRGIGSASQNNTNPLIVIDGIVSSQSLASINQRDVASMSILKDAASTALYGARGANGVIVITTKKGQQGKAKVTFEGKWGINMADQVAYPDLIENPQDVYEWAWRSIYNARRYGSVDKYTTNAQTPNTDHATAALFASQHLFNYNGGNASYPFGDKNGLGNNMLYSVPGLNTAENLTFTGGGNSASATMNSIFLVNTDGKLNPNARLLYNDDWRDYFLQNKFRQEYNLSVSGATDKTDYYISAGYLEDPSYMLGSSFERYSLRSNINTQVTKWLKAGLNMAYSRRSTRSQANRSGRNPGDASENMFAWFAEGTVLASLWQYDENGNVLRDDNGNKKVNAGTGQTYSPFGPTSPKYANNWDPIKTMTQDLDRTIYNDMNMNGYLEAAFLKDFTFRASMSVDEYFSTRTRYRQSETGRVIGDGAYGKQMAESRSINALQTLNWSHDYGKHRVSALLGHEYTTVYNNDYVAFQSAQELIPGFISPSNFIALNYSGNARYSGNGTGGDKEAIEGYFMRANYSYDDRYLFSASIRTDGSSKFRHMEDRWGVFWSLGGAWRISNESWAKDATWLTDLKLRADYGVIGNQNGIGSYSGYTTWGYSAVKYSNAAGAAANKAATWKLSQNALQNQHLTWEKVRTWDVGLDFRLWDRFYGSIDWYQRKTTDMLWATPMDIELGQTSITRNSAAMRTRGIEIDLGVDIIKTPDILWSFSVNGTHYKSILTKVPTGTGSSDLNGNWTSGTDGWAAQGLGGTSATCYLRGEGKPYYNMYLVSYMGVDQKTGLPLYSHRVTDKKVAAGTYGSAQAGDIVATTDYTKGSYIELGDATPGFIGGFSTSFTYKNLDFSATFAFQIGGKIFGTNYAYNGYYNCMGIGVPLSSEMKNNTWAPVTSDGVYANTGATHPMQIYGNPNGETSWYTSGSAWGGSWQYTDMSLFNASYLNVKNITVGYTFPQRWMDKIGIGGIRVYASLDNMWMLTSHSGIDPRTALNGGFDIGKGTYPWIRSASLGVNVTF